MVVHKKYPAGLIFRGMPTILKDIIIDRAEGVVGDGLAKFNILDHQLKLDDWQTNFIKFLNLEIGIDNYAISGSIAFRYYGFIERKSKDIDVEVSYDKQMGFVIQKLIDNGWSKCKDYGGSLKLNGRVHYRFEKNGNSICVFSLPVDTMLPLFYAKHKDEFFFLSYPGLIANAKLQYTRITSSLDTYNKHVKDLRGYNNHNEIIKHSGCVITPRRDDLQNSSSDSF